jgi:hypothetical protein
MSLAARASPVEVLGAGIADDRSDEAGPSDRHGDSDVQVFLDDDPALLDRCVENRMLLERLDGSEHEERV